jgi:putative transposase
VIVAVKRSYRFRFYPTPKQETDFAQTFGCTRFAYNYMLRLRTDAWFNEQKRIGYHETSALLTRLKSHPDFLWLNEISCIPVQQSLRHLQTAFVNFFTRRARYPIFKKKHGTQSAEYTTSGFRWDGKELRLAKMGEPLDIRWSRPIPESARVTTCTVSKDCAGRYFVSMSCDDSVTVKPESDKQVGIDLGLTHFAVLSTGEKISPPNALRKNEARLIKLQRRLAKKKLGSANRKKARQKFARLHARVADIRKDFLHKLSTRLINENQVIAVESLAVSNMQMNSRLGKSINDAGWGKFVRLLEYKAAWYGRTLIGINRWYPSTKRCNACGHIVASLPLNVREWACPECGVTHDRDINAAKNILAAGLAVSVCGENVSPVLV